MSSIESNYNAPRCSHGMPSPASCIDCMEEGPVAAPTIWRKVGGPFRPSFDGVCSCGDPILVGQDDVIQRWDYGDERTTYTHGECRP